MIRSTSLQYRSPSPQRRNPRGLAMVLAVLCAAAVPVAALGEPAAKRGGFAASAMKTVATDPLVLQGAEIDGLVFERTISGQTDLWQARLSDGAVRRLLDTPDRQETLPLWSPQAQKLLYQVRLEGSEKLILFDPSDGTETLLRVEHRGFKYAASWSPDGKRIAFGVMSPFDKKRSIREYDLKAGTTQMLGSALPDQEFIRPMYAPDGVHLSAQKRGSNMQQQIWLLERGKEARQVTRPTERSDNEASFTRNGEWIVFTSVFGTRPPNLNLIRPDGSDRRGFVFSSLTQDHWAAPSPTRDEIAFVSNRANGGDLFLSDIEETDLRNLSNSRGRYEKLPRWSPDGELLAVTVLDKTASGDPHEPHVVVFDREGEILLELPGRFASWMPPWKEPGASTLDRAAIQGK